MNDGMWTLTCLLAASSVLKSSSRPLFLICSSSAVAIFMCVSSVALRAVSSGSCVIAVFKCAAFDERSLCVVSYMLLNVYRSTNSQLRNIIDITHTRRSCNFCGILLILVQLSIDVFSNLRERVRSIFCPEKVL